MEKKESEGLMTVGERYRENLRGEAEGGSEEEAAMGQLRERWDSSKQIMRRRQP